MLCCRWKDQYLVFLYDDPTPVYVLCIQGAGFFYISRPCHPRPLRGGERWNTVRFFDDVKRS